MANLRKKKMKGKRVLSDEFMKDLKDGILSPILEAVKNDNNLILEIRNNYFTIYYRGGRLFELWEENNCYLVEDTISEYVKNKRQKTHLNKLPKKDTIKTMKEAMSWADKFYILKSIMDDYFSRSNKLEKEFQQLVVRENNILRKANETDYYILDFEYQYKNIRFDLIALRWDSTSTDRKKPENCRLSIIEMKYGDNAIAGKSGLLKHIKDAEDFLLDEKRKNDFKKEMLDLFNQKRKLGIINLGKNGNPNLVSKINEEYKIEFIALLAGHKPRAEVLEKEILKISEPENVELKFAEASFMGYALYSNSMLTLEQFKKKIHAI